MRTPWRQREGHSDLAAACGKALDETLAFFHQLNFGGESKHATVESAFLILQVVTAKHAVIKLERLSGITGERNVKRCLHARQRGGNRRALD